VETPGKKLVLPWPYPYLGKSCLSGCPFSLLSPLDLETERAHLDDTWKKVAFEDLFCAQKYRKTDNKIKNTKTIFVVLFFR
jgi:hypothetical protein